MLLPNLSLGYEDIGRESSFRRHQIVTTGIELILRDVEPDCEEISHLAFQETEIHIG